MSIERPDTVLVTGATGFVGGALVRHLRARGDSVVAQGRDAPGLAALRAQGIAVLDWDITRPLPEEKRARLGGVRRVVHCAARSAPFGRRAAFEAVNVAGTQNVLDLASAVGVTRFVYVSSPSVLFAARDQLALAEDTPLPAPFNSYARTKAAAERFVRALPALSPVILRPRGIYGPGETALLPRLLRAARRGPLPVFRGGVARIDLTYVDDVVSALVAALDGGEALTGRTYHIAGPEVLPVRDLVTQSCLRAGVQPRWRPVRLGPALAVARAAELLAAARGGREPALTRYGLALFAYQQSLDTSRARAELGWQPQVGFAEGLRRTFRKGAG